MATITEGVPEDELVTPYSMHVSAKYLELTKKKLELTRLPRELELPESRRWEQGTPKSVLEPLLDFWLEGYDWRAAETQFNLTLPQYRTTVDAPTSTNASNAQRLRIHFVHKRSKHDNAIPLLLCHTWPSSFVEVQRIIDALIDPHSLPSFGSGAQQAFHVVAPSIPGFGFSDASLAEEFGLHGTAEVFNSLMSRLGYDKYVAHGTGWGFSICRALALRHSTQCLAVHTANPSFTEPTWKGNRVGYLKYRIAKLTQAKIPALSFGYLPTELQSQDGERTADVLEHSLDLHNPKGATLHRLYSLRPQTLAYSLCDSPVGLLAALLDVIYTRLPPQSPLISRSRSPFLSPVELELQGANQHDEASSMRHSETSEAHENSSSLRQGELDTRSYAWSPTEILNFTMLQWLPGPEAALRWLRRAHIDSMESAWRTYSAVPLGISTFYSRSNSTATPLMWGAASWDIAWVKRHQRPATLPGIEAPDLLVLDLRECFGSLLSQGQLGNLPDATS
ncbi:hypothetical protein ACN47E_005920 [Coniothyrium glycines]